MKKTITILGALALAASPALALNVAPYTTQNFQNILQPTIAKSNVTVNNNIVVQSVSSYQFYFQAQLSNSNYNGFSGFLGQITFKLSDYNKHAWPVYFFQWLDDNDFQTAFFPELNHHTQQGFFHNPIVWANRLEKNMSHFGSCLDDKSQTAYNMIINSDPKYYLENFGSNVEKTYIEDAKTGKVAGIDLNFGFTYHRGHYSVVQPNFVIIMNQ